MASIYHPNKNCAQLWIKYYLGSDFYRASLHTVDKREAEILKSRVELALKEGKSRKEIEYLIKCEHPQIEPDNKPQHNVNSPYENGLIEPILEKYFKMCETYKAPRTVINDRHRLNDFFGWVKADNIRDISYQDILDYINHKNDKICAKTLNRYIDNIKSVFRYVANHDGKYLDKNPADKIKKLKVVKDLPRYLSLEEIQAIRNACPEKFLPIFETFIKTGMRKSELVYLEWQDVDLERKEIIIRSKKEKGWYPKDREGRLIPIDDGLCEILKRLKNDKKSDYVFCNSQGGPYKYNLNRLLTSIVEKAGIKQKTDFNCLRHTFAAYVCSESGIAVTSQLLGHSNIRLTRDYYVHLSNELLKTKCKLPY